MEPYTESANLKDASIYSMACRHVKYTPRIIVNPKPWVVWVKLFSISAWCAHVTLTPEDKSTIVFNKGTWNGLNGIIPTGGQTLPISKVGASLLWKKAQKNLTKNKTSETIKSAIPQRRPSSTIAAWCPWTLPSREISRHHWNMVNPKISRATKKRFMLFKWNHDNIPVVTNKPPKALTRGHGDSSTKWYGWRTKFDIGVILYLVFSIYYLENIFLL